LGSYFRAVLVLARKARPDSQHYAWLCRVGLHPDVALEYALLFARNQLGAADVRHLDHEFLLSMGVAVAKHRLEILKLARKESSSSHRKAAAIAVVLPWRATRLLAAAVHRSARSALGRLRAYRDRNRERGRDRDRAAAVLATQRVPLLRHRGGRVALAHRHSSCWSKAAPPVAAIRTGGKLLVKTLPAPAASIAACLVGTDVCSCDEDDEVVVMDGGEAMRWESMFQDLRPT
jgi:hypothetical protein